MKSWRLVDVVVAAVVAVAIGLIFYVWNTVGYAWYQAADALTPGLGGIAVGVWLMGGVIGGLIIRKPGAAIFVEVVAAVVSAGLGNQWGIETIYSGLAQGIGAEIIFALFFYRKFGVVVAALAGVGAAVGAWVLELSLSGNLAKSLEFNVIYLVTMSISGIVLAGLLSVVLVRALAATGVLDKFAAGQQARTLV